MKITTKKNLYLLGTIASLALAVFVFFWAMEPRGAEDSFFARLLVTATIEWFPLTCLFCFKEYYQAAKREEESEKNN